MYPPATSYESMSTVNSSSCSQYSIFCCIIQLYVYEYDCQSLVESSMHMCLKIRDTRKAVLQIIYSWVFKKVIEQLLYGIQVKYSYYSLLVNESFVNTSDRGLGLNTNPRWEGGVSKSVIS